MNLPLIFSYRQFRTASTVAGFLGLLYLILNIFVLGGDEFIRNLNSFIVSPLAILTAVMAARLWRQIGSGRQGRLLWHGMFLGWICWAIAESLWASYSLAGQDPYPSWADFFFLLGYLPLSVGFMSRILTLPKKPEKAQRFLIWVISLIVISLTAFFLLIPILQAYDPELLLESLLGLFYPLADLLLLLLVLNLLFTYGPGDYGLSWRLILAGFVLVTISDLFFSYADWNGLYYPDSQANLLSRLVVDVLYSTSYVLWTLGIYTFYILLREHQTLKINFQQELATNAHIFLFTNRNETVIEVSRNYRHLFPLQSPTGRPLAEALRVPEQEQEIIHNKLIADRKLSDHKISIERPSGKFQDGWLCGLPIINPPNEYLGAILLVRTFLEDEVDHELSEYQKSILPYLLDKTGSDEKNSIRLLFVEYYLAYLKSLFNLALQAGGASMSQMLLDELQTQAHKNGWGLKFNPQTILDAGMESDDTLDEALPALVETAKQFASRLTDAMTVETEMQKIHSQFNEAIHRTVLNLREITTNRV